jgi:hypothetical protein
LREAKEAAETHGDAPLDITSQSLIGYIEDMKKKRTEEKND